jgi:hypothetical protein
MRLPRRDSDNLDRLYVCGSISCLDVPIFEAETAQTAFRNMLFAVAELCNFDLFCDHLFDNAFLLILRPRRSPPTDLHLLRNYHALYALPMPFEELAKRMHRNDRNLERWQRKLRRGINKIGVFHQILKDCFARWYNKVHRGKGHGTIWAERFGSELFIEPDTELIRYLVLHHAGNALLHKESQGPGRLVRWGLTDLIEGQSCVAANLANLFGVPVAELAQSLPQQAERIAKLLDDGTLRGLSAAELSRQTGVLEFLACEWKYLSRQILLAGLSFGMMALAYPTFKGNRVYGALKLVEACILRAMKWRQVPYTLWPALSGAGWTLDLWGEFQPGTPKWAKVLEWEPPASAWLADPG